MQRWLLQTYWSYYNNIFVMSCKSAKKTYRSRKIRTRPIDPKEILQTVNDPNSLFDALSIKNIRKYKKDCLFTDLSHCSKKTKKKRNLKHSCKKTSNKENAVPQEVPPQYSPDKSLHVNRILDPFDMLFAHNESVDVQKCDVEKFDPRINFSSDDSVSFNESLQPRETTSNVVNSPPEFHLSTLKGACKDAPVLNIGHDQSKYMQQSGLDTSKRVFSHNFEIVHIDSHSKNISHSKNTSIHKMVKNLNAIRALSKCQKIMSPYVNNEQLECVQASLEPVVSTPLNATHRKSMCNISPIHRHLKKITLNDGDQDNSIHTTNQADISVNHSNFKDGSPKAIITPEIPEYSNQDEHLTLTSVNKDSIKQNKTNVPSIAMIGKHLPNNVSIDLFKSTLDDSTDANCSKQLNKTSFIDETEDTITSDNCCKFKDVTRNNSNDACINDDNVEYDFSKPINVQDMHYPTVSIERLRDSITQKYIGTQKMNQDGHLTTLKSVNKNSTEQTKSNDPSIAMIVKHLPNNVKTIIDLCESTLDDSTDANYSNPLKITSFIDQTENSIKSDNNCCNFKDVMKNNSNDACINDDNVEYNLSKPTNVQDAHYPTVSIERLRDSITQNYIRLYSEENQKISEKSEIADMKNDNYSESKCIHNDASESNVKNCNPKVHIRRLRESVLQRHLQTYTKDINAAKPESNSLKDEKDLNILCPTVHIERLPNSTLQINLCPSSGDLSSKKFECTDINNDNYSESKYTHSDSSKSNLKSGNLKVHIRKLRESILQQHQIYTEDIEAAKLDAKDFSTEIHRISGISIDDEKSDEAKMEQSEMKKNGYEIPLEAHLEKYIGEKQNTNLLCGSLLGRDCNDETNINEDLSRLSDDRTICNSHENPCYFSQIISDNITLRRSPNVPVNGHLHQNNENVKETLNTDKTASSPILNTNWKWNSQKKINSQTFKKSTNSFDNEVAITEGEEVSLYNSHDLTLASDSLLGTRLSNQTHDSTRSGKKDSEKSVNETCNLQFREVDHVHDASPHAGNQPKYKDSLKIKAITPNRENHFTSQNKNDSEFIRPSVRNSIVLQPGKKWERSLSILRRLTLKYDEAIIEIDSPAKGRKYRQSIANLMDLQKNRDSILMQCAEPKKKDSIDGPDITSRRSTIRIIREPLQADLKSTITTLEEEDVGFLSESCNDTIDISKLSISNVDNSSPLLDKIIDVSDRITSRDVVLRRCNQTDCLPFDECYTDAKLKNCRKIGEGVYGEVFLYRGDDGRARVMKVVPVDGKVRVNGELQKNFDEILSEIIIAMELSALRAPKDDLNADAVSQGSCQFEVAPSIENASDTFNEVLAVNCVYGRYPARLLDLWQLYDESRGSENDSPEIFDGDQQYVVLELANGGQDLESFQFNNAEQAYAVFYQVAFALAVGEEVHQFEHRDLHWGNVLCTPSDEKFATYVLRGATYRLPRKGVCATIIDYTLSRVSLPLAGATTQATLYNDLGADPTLFEAEGDYQFDIYRLMRERNGNAWKEFEPYTNILWLHYLVDKMITALRYNRVSTKVHKHYIGKLKELKGKILSFESTLDFVLNDNEI